MRIYIKLTEKDLPIARLHPNPKHRRAEAIPNYCACLRRNLRLAPDASLSGFADAMHENR